MTKSNYFFQCLPKEFGYLIALYEGNSGDLSFLEHLYEKFFGNILSKDEQLELIYLQTQISK